MRVSSANGSSHSGPRLQSGNPLLRDTVRGRIFSHNLFVYFSFALVIVTWVVLFRTRPGLTLRAIGERPEAAYARGTQVNRMRYFYTMLGGALIGVAGASYSLAIKAGWSANPSMDGDGWIALAIVIFAGWHPARVVLGAYLLAALRAVASELQRVLTCMLDVALCVSAVMIAHQVSEQSAGRGGRCAHPALGYDSRQ